MKRWQRWCFWAVALVLCCGLIAGWMLSSWLADDSDLLEEDRLALAAGMAVTWAGFDDPPTAGEQRALWDDLLDRCERGLLVCYQNSHEPADWDPAMGAWDAYRSGTGIDCLPQMRFWHDHHVDPAQRAWLLEHVDGLLAGPVVLDQPHRYDDLMPALINKRRICLFLAEHAVLADSDDDYDARMAVLWRMIDAFGRPTCLMDSLVTMSIRSLAIDLVLRRRRLDPAGARSLQTFLRGGGTEAQRAMNAEWLMVRSDPDGQGVLAESGSADRWLHVLWPLLVRSGRQDSLSHIRQAWAVIGLDDATALVEAERLDRAISNARSGWTRYAKLYALMAVPSVSALVQGALRQRLRARACLSIFADEPWPTDPWSPSAEPVRKLFEDNALRAFYSVGEDGIDSGHEAEDHVYWLGSPPENGH